MREILVLYGAPTVGKDTLTAELAGRNLGFEHFKKVKSGTGSRHGYQIVDEDRLAELRSSGRLISEVERYGSVYAIDALDLDRSLARGVIPVIHSASVSEVQRLHEIGALVVIISCERGTARARLSQRDSTSVDERLAVFDMVAAQSHRLAGVAHLHLSSDNTPVAVLADRVADLLLANRRDRL